MVTGEAPVGCDALLYSHFMLPLLTQLNSLWQGAGRGERRRPVIGLNGPVGAGKSTLGRQLQELAPRFGLKLMVASIDDLYLSWPERGERLAGNPFGVTRVPPGSHDLPLLLSALETWRQGGSLRLPRFDKTLSGGEGDRAGWRQLDCDALVLEGWLMGCRALPELQLDALIAAAEARELEWPGSLIDSVEPFWTGSESPGAPPLRAEEWRWLPRWNRELKAYHALWQALDGLWVLRPEHWGLPRRWRFQAEARQRRRGGGWLAAEPLERMVRSSLCSLPPALYQDPLIPPLALEAGHTETQGARWVSQQRPGPTPAIPVSPKAPPCGGTPADMPSPRSRQPEGPTWIPLGSQVAIPKSELQQGGEQCDEPPVQAVAWLDGRRRCRHAWLQASASPSSSATG